MLDAIRWWSRCDAIPDRDGRKDGQTDRRMVLYISTANTTLMNSIMPVKGKDQPIYNSITFTAKKVQIKAVGACALLLLVVAACYLGHLKHSLVID